MDKKKSVEISLRPQAWQEDAPSEEAVQTSQAYLSPGGQA